MPSAWHDSRVPLPEFRWARVDDTADRADLAVLSAAERERYDSSTSSARAPFLAGRMLLRELAGDLTGITPGAVDLVAVCPDCGGPHGQPVVVGSRLQVSLTHGPGVVAAAASWGAPIGIDLEPRTADPGVLAALGTVTGTASVEHWSRVEAVLKADGRGLRVDPSRVAFGTVDGRLEGWVEGAETRYGVSELELAPGIRISVAVAI